MYNFIKRLLPVCVIFALCGCTLGTSITYLDKSYKTDTVTVDLLIPQITGLKDTDFQDTVNLEIEDTCKEFLNKFKASAEKISHPSVFTAETQNYNSGDLLSLVTQISYYTQKPHNNSYRITKNINTASSCEVTLSDLFSDSGYIDHINLVLSEMVTNNPDNYSDLWAKPVLAQDQPFYIKDGNLVIYYPPYELSYYTRGFVEFPIPLDELSGYLSEEYRQMLIKKS